jgi:hypothetical protein
MWHYCAVAKAQVLGGVQKLLAWNRPVEEKNVSLRKRLAYVQFEAERRMST